MTIEKLSASAASKHLNCHASANLEAAIPNWVPPVKDDAADNAANRGTIMHAIMAELCSLSPFDALKFSEALSYISSVRKLRRFKALIEQPVEIDWLVSKPKTTADLVLYTKDELHVLDLKTGKIPVSAVENTQLLYYARAYSYLSPKAKDVTVHIVQPWADNIEAWKIPVARLIKFELDCVQAEAAIAAGDTTFSPGDHCMFCAANPHGRGLKGRPFCPAMMSVLYPQPLPDYDAMLED